MANATITVLEADGVTQTDVVVLDVARQAAAASKSVALATEDKAVLDAIAASLAILDNVTQTTAAPTGADTALVVAIHPDSVNANGQATMVNSAPVVLASNHSAVPISNTPLTNFGAGEYETVAASQTAQALGATGATGDYISGILVIPATTTPGVVTLLDNATSIPVFVGGASSVSNLVPFFIPLGMISVSGAWKITTGANVSCIGIGNFT